VQRSATVAFGQSLDPQVLARAVEAAGDCDVFLTAGTSLQVNPAAGLCRVALGNGARLVVANGSATPYDDVAHAVVRADLTEVLPALLA
jgi:NAD-dependent deacetylase